MTAQISKKQSQELLLWNKTHLNLIRLNDADDQQLIDSLQTVSYSGYNHMSVFEYINSNRSLLIGDIGKRRALKGISYTIHDFYDALRFPVNNFSGSITKDQCATLLRKTGSDQIIIIDVDDADSFSVYIYNLISGWQYHRLDIPDLVNRNNSIPGDVEEVLTEGFFKQLNQYLDYDQSLTTSWVFSGEVTTLINQSLGRFCLKFFSNLQTSLPFINKIFFDSFNLLNYLKIFSDSFLSLNFSKIIDEIPLSIVNMEAFEGNVEEVHLVLYDSELGPRDEFVKIKKNDLNLVSVEEKSSIQGVTNISMSPGNIWFWQKSDMANLKKVEKNKKISLISEFQIKPIKDIRTLNFRKIVKDSLWEVDLSFEGLSQKKSILEISPKIFLRIKGVKKEDLLVVHEQRVHEGQLLNKSRNVKLLFETKEYRSPVDGYISTNYVDQGFLVIKLLEKKKKDLSWLNARKVVKEGRGLKGSVYVLKSFALPLAFSIGGSYSGTLVIADSFKEAEKYAQEMINIVLVVNFALKQDEMVYLYKMNTRSIIGAGLLTDIAQVDEAYWQLFNYSSVTNTGIDQNRYAFDNYILDMLRNNEGGEVFVDSKQKELKFLSNAMQKGKFGMIKNRKNGDGGALFDLDSVEVLEKGQQVIVHSNEALFKKAEIMVRQGSDLVLKDIETNSLLKDKSQNVSLVE